MNVEKHSVIAIILAVCGFVLVYVGATVNSIFFLATIGVWVIVAVWVWEIKRTEKEEGKEILL
jgi:ABC-type iron transport system FetAB permease component